MTKQEFFENTMVEVSNQEFEAIHEVYMHSDLDKYEFCYMWCKMNKTRVQNAKIEAKAKQREACYKDSLFKFYHKFDGEDMKNVYCTPICYVKISTYEVQAISYAGIKLEGENGRMKYLSDIRYEIGKYLGMF